MTDPFLFQVKAVKKIDRLGGRALLAHDMGLGKSFMSLLWASRNSKVRPIIVVCPASLKWNWQREVKLHLGWRAVVLEGMNSRGKKLSKSTPVYIINYDILKGWYKKLIRLNPKLIIIDECHALKNKSTKRSKLTKLLCEKCPHVIALSGTPLLNRPAELYPILNILRPDLYNSPMAFYFRYCQPKKTPWGWQYKGAARLPELHAKLKREIMCRCRKADVMEQLPAKQRNICLMEIAKRKDYEKAERDFIKWLSERNPHLAKKAQKAEFLVKTGYLKRLAAELKLPYIIEWIENFMEESDEKLIVFAHHKSVVAAIHKHFQRCSVTVTGETLGKKRQAAFDQFLGTSNCRLLIGNLQAAGVGWSALGVSNVAFAEFSWNPADHTQGEDRTHGIGRGQKGIQSSSWWLIAKGTIEEKLCKLLQDKQEILDATLDGKKTKTLDIFDELEKALLENNRR
jgi:SWI/SNF-related matrix-associated actin-dependent regulator of chromatin subfamily A-like protein 1